MRQSKAKPIIFSAAQPSGNFTLGNYIGALRNWSELQENYTSLFALADLHTITVRQEARKFHQNSYDALAVYLAAGLDPKKNIIFMQSHVPAHAQLAWVLNCYTYIGELSRMTQFKDKSGKNADNINAGLFTYPVLMAADILLYQANLVPVGFDQKQHVELTRDIALRFNNIYGPIFTVPEVYHPTLGARIMSLQSPDKKMSKSDANGDGVIYLLDSKDVINDKIKRAVTDSGKDISYDPKNKPGVANLLSILAAVSGKSIDEHVSSLDGQGYGKLKSVVSEALTEFLHPFQERYQKMRSDIKYLDDILKDGASRAGELAQKTLVKVYDVLGFVLPQP